MSGVGFHIRSFGCKVNQYEEQYMRERLRSYGFREMDISCADNIIINSCTVTATADRKARQALRSAKRVNPKAKVLFTGCLAARPEDIAALSSMGEIDEVIPLSQKLGLPEHLAGRTGMPVRVVPISCEETLNSFRPHTRAFLKIQDGCLQKCSYCKVPLVRSVIRSKAIDTVIKEFKTLLRNGHREIVLTGTCLGAWKDGTAGLCELITRIQGVKGRFRVRLSSLEPDHVSKELAAVLAVSGKICEHVHLPLQSGSDEVLRSMGRPYTLADFEQKIGMVRSFMPRAGITLDVIVGYPSESRGDFERTLAAVDAISPSRLHVFRYSPRKGTAAYGLSGRVPAREAKERSQRLIRLGQEKSFSFAKQFIGQELEVLFEERTAEGAYLGYTREYVRVKCMPCNPSVSARGNLTRVIALSFNEAEGVLDAVEQPFRSGCLEKK